MSNDFGVIGLGVMGSNLALNIESRGYSVAIWTRNPGHLEEFIQGPGRGKKFESHAELKAFTASLARPRKLILMIKAGKPVDEMLAQLLILLEKDDIVVDAGNSLYTDTERRARESHATGIRFVGMGVSGGEEGARKGPSIMPGGEESAWRELEPMLTRIAAVSDSGPCVAYMGKGGAGHFVKMVHNGIEYGDMQAIAESYDLLRRGLGLSNAEAADVFEKWNAGPLKSFLIEITPKVLRYKEKDGRSLVDLILDSAGEKGTGKWTVEAAFEHGAAVPTIAAAVDARVLSARKKEREKGAELYASLRKPQKYRPDRIFADRIAKALWAARVCAYAQGFDLLARADAARGFGLRLDEAARVWTGGCIIRAALLSKVRAAFHRTTSVGEAGSPDVVRYPNLIYDESIAKELAGHFDAWREVITFAHVMAIPVPAISASFAYFGLLTTARLPANLTQAQRDYFGAHTYERIDKPGIFHTDWS